MATISLIAAIGPNNELGKDNHLLYHISEDLKFFKKETTGKKIILGRKTLESLPGLLPNRKHLVLTHQDLPENENLIVFHNIEDLLKYINNLDEEVMVIGGAEIYKQFLPYANKLILTEISSSPKELEADAYFPTFDKKEWNRSILCSHKQEDLAYDHVVYNEK